MTLVLKKIHLKCYPVELKHPRYIYCYLMNLQRSNLSISRFLFHLNNMALQSTPMFKRKLAAPAPSVGKGSAPSTSRSGSASQGPSIFGILASKRLAKQFVSRFTLRRSGRLHSNQGSSRGVPNVPKEPTYRMEPKRKFNSSPVEKIMKEILDSRLEGFEYSHKRCAMMSKILTEEIKERVKKLRFDRYKIVCIVTMGEKKGQDMRLSSRCAWDTSVDTSATYTWQDGQAFCSATVYGIYHE